MIINPIKRTIIMNYHPHIMKKIPIITLLVLLLATGCQKEERAYRFLAVAEVPGNPNEEEKTALVNESYIHWQLDDEISVANTNNEMVSAKFTYGSDEEEAIFEIQNDQHKMIESDEFVALFPHHANNSIQGTNATIYLESEQGYANDGTFAPKAVPMAAYRDGASGVELVRIQFHNLFGLVRVQLIDGTTNKKQLSNITFTSNDKNLAGYFSVNGITSSTPSLSAGNGSKTVTITPDSPLSFSGNTPLTFYLSLPALSGTGSTSYSITMTANTTDNHHVTRQFSVSINRNGITKLPALIVTGWSNTENSGSTTSGISGNGTIHRPLLIYTADELVKLRDACNSNSTDFNGADLTTSNWYVKIMRSDIVLDNDNWTVPFQNFRGQMSYAATQNTSNPGITNNSSYPIFNEIATRANVDGLIVKGSRSITVQASSQATFSPLCNINNGNILHCGIAAGASYILSGSSATSMGGLCVTNNGVILGSNCRATLVAGKVGAICLENNGTIKACQTPSPMQAASGTNRATSAAGICHTNNGTINDCYFAANTSKSQTQWGGIVYTNNENATIELCYVDAAGVIQSSTSVGGIVHTNYGTVNNCWNDAELIVDANGLGGIVHTLAGGEVRNCYRNTTASLTCKAGPAGGLVASLTGGALRNCYAYCNISSSTTPSKGIVAGNIGSNATIENCYGRQLSTTDNIPFYSQNNGTLINCFHHLTTANGLSTYTDATELASQLNSYSTQLGDSYYGWTVSNGTAVLDFSTK